MGRLKLFGAVLSAMQIDATGRIAIVYVDHEMAREAGGTYEDTEGLINLPLTVKEIQAVVFFKQARARRLAREHALEGRHRHRRRREGVRRRRPQERRRLHGDRRDRCAAEAPASRRSNRRSMDGLLVVDKPAGPDVARRRGADAARARRAAHRAHRHARSAGDRRAAARARPRDAPRAVPERARQELRRVDSPGRRDRHATTSRGDGNGPRRTARGRRARRSTTALDVAHAATFEQMPPAYSAKKVGGRRAYELARRDEPVALTAAPVRVRGSSCSRSGTTAAASRSPARPASTCGRSRATWASAAGPAPAWKR